MSRSEALEDLSLLQLMQSYTWRNKRWSKHRKSTTVVTRVYPRLSPNPDDPSYEEYCRIKITLHHPFRAIEQLQSLDDNGELRTWAAIFGDCGNNDVHPPDTLREWSQEHGEPTAEEDDDEEMNPDLEELDEADWQIYARLMPNVQIPQYTADDLGRRPIDDGWNMDNAHTRWENIDSLASYIGDQRKASPVNDGTIEDVDETSLIDLDTLEGEQRQVFDCFIDNYKAVLSGDNPPASCMQINIDGTAGCGKTYLIRAICQELRRLASENGLRDPVRVLAPSGVAAWNISGRTVHSGLAIPATYGSFAKLSGARLATLQQQWQGVHLVIIDEKSMLGQRQLARVDSRLRQMKPNDVPFGGFNIALIGDFAQLPPVGDRALYASPARVEDTSENAQLSRDGHTLYQLFLRSFCLQVVHRQQGNSEAQLKFRALLAHAASGGLTVEDWNLLITRCKENLSPAEQASFDDTTCLLTKTEAVHAANMRQLIALNKPCARIKAKHDGGAAAVKASSEDAAGLEPEVILAEGAKVMISRNIWQDHGMFIRT